MVTDAASIKRRRLRRMALLSVLAALITLALKFWAWQLTASVGLLSDALESLVNLAAALLAYVILGVATQPADADHPFGHDKAEYFSSAAEGLFILAAAVGIAWAAWQRLLAPVPLQGLDIGLALALLASLVNGVVAMRLLRVGREEDSLTLRADGHHLMADVWTSVAVVLGIGLVWVWPKQVWLDPVIALLVAVQLVVTGLRLLAPSLAGLMDEALPQAEIRALLVAAEALLPEQAELGALRTRKSGHRRFVDGNLLLPGDMSVADAHALCDQLEDAMRATLPACDITLHLAPLQERERHR